MKFQINQKDLAKHINIVQKAISQRTAMPILEGILFIVKDNYLIMKATDLEISIQTKIPVTMEREGLIVINSSIIGNIVRKLSPSVVCFDVENDKIHLTCEHSEFNLIGQDPVDYPELPDNDGDESISIDANKLKEAINYTDFSASTDETRPQFTGVLFEKKNGFLNFVSMDGYRLSLYNMPLEDKNNISMIVPTRVLKDLTKIMDENSIVTMKPLTGHILFEVDDTEIYSKLLEGNFIEYDSVIPKEQETKVIVQRKMLYDAVERASLLARSDRINLVNLRIENNMIHINSTAEIGSVNEEVPIEMEGKDVKIAFNARYLNEGLKVMDSEEIEIIFNGSLNACVMHPISDEMDYTYLVLPVRVARGE